jgi:hypothetical protein
MINILSQKGKKNHLHIWAFRLENFHFEEIQLSLIGWKKDAIWLILGIICTMLTFYLW